MKQFRTIATCTVCCKPAMPVLLQFCRRKKADVPKTDTSTTTKETPSLLHPWAPNRWQLCAIKWPTMPNGKQLTIRMTLHGPPTACTIMLLQEAWTTQYRNGSYVDGWCGKGAKAFELPGLKDKMKKGGVYRPAGLLIFRGCWKRHNRNYANNTGYDTQPCKRLGCLEKAYDSHLQKEPMPALRKE